MFIMLRATLVISFSLIAFGSSAGITLDTNSKQYQEALQQFQNSFTLNQAKNLLGQPTQPIGAAQPNPVPQQNLMGQQSLPNPGPQGNGLPQVGVQGNGQPQVGVQGNGQPQVGALPQANAQAPSLMQSLPGILQPRIPEVPSGIKKGFSAIRENLSEAGANQGNNFVGGVGEVIKESDKVLTEKSNQFKRVTSAKGQFIRQASRTAGTGLVKIPEAGTSILHKTEDFMQQPTRYMNPLNIMWDTIDFLGLRLPWAPKPTDEEIFMKMAIQKKLQALRDGHSEIYYKLMGNQEIYNWMQSRPQIYQYLLENPQELELYLDNPGKLIELNQALNQAQQQQQPQPQKGLFW